MTNQRDMQNTIDQVAAFHKKNPGIMAKEIISELGISRYRVHNALAVLGLPTNQHRLPGFDKIAAVHASNPAASVAAIAKEVEVSQSRVRHVLAILDRL